MHYTGCFTGTEKNCELFAQTFQPSSNLGHVEMFTDTWTFRNLLFKLSENCTYFLVELLGKNTEIYNICEYTEKNIKNKMNKMLSASLRTGSLG